MECVCVCVCVRTRVCLKQVVTSESWSLKRNLFQNSARAFDGRRGGGGHRQKVIPVTHSLPPSSASSASLLRNGLSRSLSLSAPLCPRRVTERDAATARKATDVSKHRFNRLEVAEASLAARRTHGPRFEPQPNCWLRLEGSACSTFTHSLTHSISGVQRVSGWVSEWVSEWVSGSLFSQTELLSESMERASLVSIPFHSISAAVGLIYLIYGLSAHWPPPPQQPQQGRTAPTDTDTLPKFYYVLAFIGFRYEAGRQVDGLGIEAAFSIDFFLSKFGVTLVSERVSHTTWQQDSAKKSVLLSTSSSSSMKSERERERKSLDAVLYFYRGRQAGRLKGCAGLLAGNFSAAMEGRRCTRFPPLCCAVRM